MHINYYMRTLSYQPMKADNELYQPKAVIGCHPERSEGSDVPGTEILRCAQDDNRLPLSVVKVHHRRKGM